MTHISPHAITQLAAEHNSESSYGNDFIGTRKGKYGPFSYTLICPTDSDRLVAS